MNETTNKIYVVTAVDCGETCDGHARVLGAYRDKTEAEKYVRNDMNAYASARSCDDVRVDFEQMEIIDGSEDVVCCWSIDETTVK